MRLRQTKWAGRNQNQENQFTPKTNRGGIESSLGLLETTGEIVWVDLMIRDSANDLLNEDKETIIAYVQTIMLIGLALLSSIVGMFLL